MDPDTGSTKKITDRGFTIPEIEITAPDGSKVDRDTGFVIPAIEITAPDGSKVDVETVSSSKVVEEVKTVEFKFDESASALIDLIKGSGSGENAQYSNEPKKPFLVLMKEKAKAAVANVRSVLTQEKLYGYLTNQTLLTIFGLTFSLSSSVILSLTCLAVLYGLLRIVYYNEDNTMVHNEIEIPLQTQLTAYVLVVIPFLILANAIQPFFLAVAICSMSIGMFTVYDSLKDSFAELREKLDENF